MKFNAISSNYPSRRSLVYGKRGMVCTTQPLAAQAGLDILKKGGNAIDAAIATAICMTILEPTSNGLGSDAFALVWVKDKLHGLNGSGHAPKLLTAEHVKGKGASDEVPDRGWLPVTVPGAPSAWAEIHKRFGKLPFEELFEAAIDLAENGFALQPITSFLWAESYKTFEKYKGQEEFKPFFETFFDNGIPKAGSIVKLPNHAKTLRLLAKSYCEAYYTGEIADAIDAFSQQTCGCIRKDDLSSYKAEWVEPIKTNYQGYEVCEIPPNGHGIVALMTLNILSKFEFDTRDSEETVHKQLEAMKLGFTDGKTYIADSRHMKTEVEFLLSDEYATKRSKEIGETALMPKPIDVNCGGTIYLATADEEGNMVSFIQSNYKGFGSGIVVPGYGIALNNRGNCFSLDSAADNYLEPDKKPYHTIIPGFLLKDNKAVGPFGVMGGFMQPQGHVQVIMNMIKFGLNPQEALDAPRWQWTKEKDVELEIGHEALAEGLRRRGHNVVVKEDFTEFGRGQIILRTEDDTLVGATEPRADGFIAVW